MPSISHFGSISAVPRTYSLLNFSPVQGYYIDGLSIIDSNKHGTFITTGDYRFPVKYEKQAQIHSSLFGNPNSKTISLQNKIKDSTYSTRGLTIGNSKSTGSIENIYHKMPKLKIEQTIGNASPDDVFLKIKRYETRVLSSGYFAKPKEGQIYLMGRSIISHGRNNIPENWAGLYADSHKNFEYYNRLPQQEFLKRIKGGSFFGHVYKLRKNYKFYIPSKSLDGQIINSVAGGLSPLAENLTKTAMRREMKQLPMKLLAHFVPQLVKKSAPFMSAVGIVATGAYIATHLASDPAKKV